MPYNQSFDVTERAYLEQRNTEEIQIFTYYIEHKSDCGFLEIQFI